MWLYVPTILFIIKILSMIFNLIVVIIIIMMLNNYFTFEVCVCRDENKLACWQEQNMQYFTPVWPGVAVSSKYVIIIFLSGQIITKLQSLNCRLVTPNLFIYLFVPLWLGIQSFYTIYGHVCYFSLYWDNNSMLIVHGTIRYTIYGYTRFYLVP